MSTRGPHDSGADIEHCGGRITIKPALVLTFVAVTSAVLPISADTLFGYVPRTYAAQSASEQTLPYRLHVPKNYDASKSYPLVLFLHGAGENGNDNQLQITNDEFNNESCIVKEFSSDAVQNKYPSFVVAPQCPADEQWVDADWAMGSYTNVPISDEMRSVQSLIGALRKEFSIDSSRIYVAGLSMGGFGTWDVIERNPKLFAAAIPICGGADTATSVVAGIKTLPIWTFHGDQDGTVPVTGTREIVAALKSMGSPVKYTEIKGWDHNAWTVACTTSTLMDWLFSQRLTTTRVALPLSANMLPRSIDESRPRRLTDAAGRAIYFVVNENENRCSAPMESPSGIRLVRTLPGPARRLHARP